MVTRILFIENLMNQGSLLMVDIRYNIPVNRQKVKDSQVPRIHPWFISNLTAWLPSAFSLFRLFPWAIYHSVILYEIFYKWKLISIHEQLLLNDNMQKVDITGIPEDWFCWSLITIYCGWLNINFVSNTYQLCCWCRFDIVSFYSRKNEKSI